MLLAWPHHFINLASPTPFYLLKCLYQARKVSMSCICVLGVSIVSLSVIFLLDFGTVPTVWYILFFTLLGKQLKRWIIRGIDFPSFYNFSIGFWNCSNSVVFFLLFTLLGKRLTRWLLDCMIDPVITQLVERRTVVECKLDIVRSVVRGIIFIDSLHLTSIPLCAMCVKIIKQKELIYVLQKPTKLDLSSYLYYTECKK